MIRNYTTKKHYLHSDPRDDIMFPNPNCYRLRVLAKEFNKTVSSMMQDKFKSLSKRLGNYVTSVSLDSHPSANGILGTQKKLY